MIHEGTPNEPPPFESPNKTPPEGPRAWPPEDEIVAVKIMGDFVEAGSGLIVNEIEVLHSGWGEFPFTMPSDSNMDPQLFAIVPRFLMTFLFSNIPEFEITFAFVMFPAFVTLTLGSITRFVPAPM